MSIKVASYIWEHSAQKGTALLMLLAIADHANDDGIAWPSVKTLAAKARISERQAKRIIRQLIDEGEVKVNVGGGRGHANLYTVVIEKGDTGDTVSVKGDIQGIKGDIQGIKGDIQGQRVTSRVIKGDTAMSPEPLEPSLEPLKKPFKQKTTTPLPSHLATPTALNAYGEWLQYHEDRGRPLTRATCMKQFKSLSDWGEERWAAAIDFSIGQSYTGLIEPKRANNGQDEPGAFAAGRKILEDIEHGNA